MSLLRDMHPPDTSSPTAPSLRLAVLLGDPRNLRSMNARQFRRWLAKHGCTFESKKSGSGHLIVRRSELPMHGGGKQLGSGLIAKIKKDLGLI